VTLPSPSCDGPIGRLDPRGRVLAAAAFALLTVGLNRLPALGAALALAAAAVVLSGLKGGAILRRLLALDGLMAVTLLTLPFTVPGDPLAGPFGVEVSRPGALRALAILLKADAVVLMVLALLGTLETVVLGRALGRLGAPEKLVRLYLFTVRYVAVLHREYRRLRTAMRARAFVMRCDRRTWTAAGHLFGMLLVRSIERSERIVAAMRCRGFEGSFPTLDEPGRFRPADGAFALAAMAGMVVLVSIEAF
jgi:cobalt/nickel transport system permease protein